MTTMTAVEQFSMSERIGRAYATAMYAEDIANDDIGTESPAIIRSNALNFLMHKADFSYVTPEQLKGFCHDVANGQHTTFNKDGIGSLPYKMIAMTLYEQVELIPDAHETLTAGGVGLTALDAAEKWSDHFRFSKKLGAWALAAVVVVGGAALAFALTHPPTFPKPDLRKTGALEPTMDMSVRPTTAQAAVPHVLPTLTRT